MEEDKYWLVSGIVNSHIPLGNNGSKSITEGCNTIHYGNRADAIKEFIDMYNNAEDTYMSQFNISLNATLINVFEISKEEYDIIKKQHDRQVKKIQDMFSFITQPPETDVEQ